MMLNSSGTKPENTAVLGTTVLDHCARYANRGQTVNPVCICISYCSWLRGAESENLKATQAVICAGTSVKMFRNNL